MPRQSVGASPSPLSSAGNGQILDAGDLVSQFAAVRNCTEKLCQPLVTEDYVIQSMPDASPVKWHLAHTSWFFETFVLMPYLPNYRAFHPQFNFLFNSYYNAVGPRWPRPQRSVLSRPTVAEIYRYRKHIDDHMAQLLQRDHAGASDRLADTVVLGLNHEQQHQELILTDLKHAWAANPLHPVYCEARPDNGRPPLRDWLTFEEGLAGIGHQGEGFAFDNELPRHRTFLQGFQLATSLVTSGEYLEFMSDGGYDRADLWLSDGWAARQERDWTSPLYWERGNNEWVIQTFAGPQALTPAQPVCHVSYYEADAFARWAGSRLPTEFEWERAAGAAPLAGHFLEGGRFHPSAGVAGDDHGPLFQLYGDVWHWTASPYTGYPGYSPPTGALGEYNGKFMCNQLVLRGASCATPRTHARRTYRNFFPPDARWQFTGIRLARDLP
jgi:ergothioneine biosynthesis protein EgtB